MGIGGRKKQAPRQRVGVDPVLKRLDPEQLFQLKLREADSHEVGVKIIGGAVLLVLSIFPLAVLWLIAKEFAGRDTEVDLTITISVTIALSLAVAGLSGWVKKRGRELTRLYKRNDVLRNAVHELRGRLKAEGLSADLSDAVEAELKNR
jgi:hypothetical protein